MHSWVETSNGDRATFSDFESVGREFESLRAHRQLLHDDLRLIVLQGTLLTRTAVRRLTFAAGFCR